MFLFLGQLADQNLLKKLRNEKFDVAIGETMDRCFYLLVRALDIPVHLSAFATPILEGNIIPFGIPNPPSYVPGNSYVDRKYLQPFHLQMGIKKERNLFHRLFTSQK